MKKWTATEWCLVILTCTIPISMLGVVIIRVVTGSPISDNATELVKNMLQIVAGGVLTTLGSMLGIKNKQQEDSK